MRLHNPHGKTVWTKQVQIPATTTLDLNSLALPHDYYSLSASAEGYIRAYTSVHSSESGISLSGGEVMLYLYRKRYVLIRYACNHDDSRDLSPEKVGQTRGRG